MAHSDKYRMVSWWIYLDDIMGWPRPELEEKIRRRAELMARNNVNAAIIFGAHFRWDFMPFWGQLHDMLQFVAQELHRHNIRFFDHHSATLVRRFPSVDARRELGRVNNYQLAPDPEIAAEWTFRGHRLNDWRMISTVDGKQPNPGYVAEEFCISNPEFIECYCEYVRKLTSEVELDGLSCDDAFFYPRFYACACRYCLGNFGHALPPASDLNFWGNWSNPLFREWIQMRYRQVAVFNRKVREVLPAHMDLTNCCSGSISSSSNETCCTYEEFCHSASVVELEMCGDSIQQDGSLRHLASQLHHLAVAEQFALPVFGLGYAYTVPGANHVWALNKFLGAGTWLSSQWSRLGLLDRELAKLSEDAVLAEQIFTAEKTFSDWFEGERMSDVAVLFSRDTRDNYGGYMADYGHDYNRACEWLFEHGYDFDTVLRIPAPESRFKVLVIPSAAWLVGTEREALRRWLAAGKSVVACGPLGIFDEQGARNPMFPEIRLPELQRTPKFPNDTWEPVEPARCENEERWHELAPNLLWHPRRIQDGLELQMPFAPAENPEGWLIRKYRDRDGRLLIHGLAANYDFKLDEELEAKRTFRKKNGSNNIIAEIMPKGQATRLDFSSRAGKFELLYPLHEPQLTVPADKVFTVPPEVYYFILRINE